MTTAFNDVAPALAQRLRYEITTQFNRSSVTLNLLAKRPGKGKNIAWDIGIGTATGQIFDDGQTVSVFQTDSELQATLPWGEYGDAFKVTGRAEDAAAGDDTELGALWMRRLMGARTRSAAKINSDVWTGDGTGTPQKLLGISVAGGALDSTGTYAGHNRATYPQWGGNVLANGGIPRAMSRSLLMYAFEVCFTASGGSPTYGITTPSIWRLLGELFTQKDEGQKSIYIRGNQVVAADGFMAVEVNGVPIFRDISCPAGTLALFNNDHIGMEYLPPASARVARGKIKAIVPIAGLRQEQDMFGAPGGGGALNANVIELPAAGNFDNWMIDSTIQLWCDKPNAHVLIKDIATNTQS